MLHFISDFRKQSQLIFKMSENNILSCSELKCMWHSSILHGNIFPLLTHSSISTLFPQAKFQFKKTIS